VAPAPEQATVETPQPGEITTTGQSLATEATDSEPREPQAAAVQPAQPQPRYGTPGYGYYPQQPNWQQPYYRPAYPQQYPAR